MPAAALIRDCLRVDEVLYIGFERREFSFVILRGTGHRLRAALVGAAAAGPANRTRPRPPARLANFLQSTIALAWRDRRPGRRLGFLPVVGGSAGITPFVTGAAVSLLAVTGVFVQPWAGWGPNAGQLRDRPGMSIGIGTAAVGLLAGVVIPGIVGILIAAVLIGAGTGLATPIAFAHLAGTTPTERF